MSELRDLGGGVWSFQGPLWQTNSLLAVAGDDALLCDPAFTPVEIEAIAAELKRRAGGRSFLLVTHADYDHVCGIPYFPDAEVVAGADTAEKVRDGSAASGLAGGGAEWGVQWPADLRVDRTPAPGEELDCGAFRVAAIDSPSHGRDGLGYVLLEQGILLPGDNLSSITYPLLAGPLARAREATEQLLEAFARYALRHVVPGHGPVLAPDEARRIGEADLRYLERLDAAAREAAAEGLSLDPPSSVLAGGPPGRLGRVPVPQLRPDAWARCGNAKRSGRVQAASGGRSPAGKRPRRPRRAIRPARIGGSRLSPGYALVQVYEVEPPRPNTVDFDIYDIRGGNGRRALGDVGIAA